VSVERTYLPPVSESQIRAVLSSEAVTICRPSGLNAALRTRRWCPVSARTSSQDLAFQIRAVLSQDAVTICPAVAAERSAIDLPLVSDELKNRPTGSRPHSPAINSAATDHASPATSDGPTDSSNPASRLADRGSDRLEVGVFAVAGILMGLFGADALAAHQLALNVVSLTFMIPLGIGQAATVRVAFELGALAPRAAHRAGAVALLVGVIIMMACGLLI
jgi:hypothetical protein